MGGGGISELPAFASPGEEASAPERLVRDKGTPSGVWGDSATRNRCSRWWFRCGMGFKCWKSFSSGRGCRASHTKSTGGKLSPPLAVQMGNGNAPLGSSGPGARLPVPPGSPRAVCSGKRSQEGRAGLGSRSLSCVCVSQRARMLGYAGKTRHRFLGSLSLLWDTSG